MEDGYFVKWEKHHSALVSVFDNLYKHNVMVDITLAAENQFIKAHRIVLMACSPYFENLLCQHSDNYPIVWMNMKFTELQALVDFCYRGEVKLPQAELPGFLNAARLLHIKGLCETTDGNKKRRSSTTQDGNTKKRRGVSPEISLRENNSFDTPAKGDTRTKPSSAEDKQTNGGEVNQSLTGGDSDNSDIDTDDESSGGEEKEAVVLEHIISTGATQYVYRWTCNKCGEALPTRSAFIEHRRLCQDSNDLDSTHHPWTCHQCPNSYKNKKDLVRHLSFCGVPTERHICERCGNTYKYERGLKRHKVYCGTNVKPMVCSNCGKTYKYKRGLRRHQKQQCGMRFLPFGVVLPKLGEDPARIPVKVKEEILPPMEDPEEETTPSNPSTCKICGKVYKYKKSFMNHLIICKITEDSKLTMEKGIEIDVKVDASNAEKLSSSPSDKVLEKDKDETSEKKHDVSSDSEKSITKPDEVPKEKEQVEENKSKETEESKSKETKENTLKEDSLKEDSLKEDSLKEDSLKEDSLKENSQSPNNC